jgi:agmatine deiminase
MAVPAMTHGRRLPGEWEPHEATILAWPHNTRDWPGKFPPIRWVYTEIIRQAARFERVFVVVQSSAQEKAARRALAAAGAALEPVRFMIRQTDRSWLRDSMPAIVEGPEGTRQAVAFAFNAWAKPGDYYALDRGLPAAVAEHLAIPLVPVSHRGRHVVLEGGAIDINGRGTLIATEECLLHDSIQVRNPGFTRADYEKVFEEYLGVTTVIWLGRGIAGDDTHGHVDDLCRFADPRTIVTCTEPDPADVNYSALAENAERLRGARLEDGSAPRVVSLPMPSPVVFDGMRLPASYANFLVTNGCVLVPTFNDPHDRHALGILADVFPGREIVGIHAVDLVWGLGTLHCLSHEIPAASPGAPT